MSVGKVDDLVSQKALDQIEQLLEKLGITTDAMASATEQAIRLNAAIGNSRTFTDYSRNTQQAELALERLRREQTNVAIAQERLQQATLRTQAAQERANRVISTSTTEWSKLKKSFDEATAAAREAGVRFGADSQQFLTAAERVRTLRGQLDAIDQPLGNFQRNVGNYANSIGNLLSRAFSGIRFLANVIPNFGIGTFFLTLGTGIGIAADKLGILDFVVDKLGLKITQAVKDQKALNEVFAEGDKQAGEQITHLQYLYKAATDVNNSTKDRKLAVNELQKEFPNYFKNISDETILNGGAKKSYDELSSSIIENARALAAANKIAELRGKILDTDVQKAKIRAAEGNELIKIQQDIKSGKYDVTTGTGEQGGSDILADQSAKKSHERAIKAIKDQDDLKKGYEATIKVIESVVGGGTKIGNALAGDRDNTDKPKKQNDTQLLSERLKAVRALEDITLQSEKASYQERLDAIYNFEKDSENLILTAEKRKVITELEASNMAADIEKTGNAQRIKIEADVQKELERLFKQGASTLEAGLQQQVIDFKDAQDTKLLEIDRFKSESLKGLADQYRDGTITAAEYNQAVYDIDAQSAQDRVQLQIDTITKIINARKDDLKFGIGSAKELQKAQDDLTKLQIQKSDLATKVEIDNVMKLQQAKLALANLEKELLNQSIDLIKQLVDQGYQNQLDALQKQSEQINQNGDNEKSRINNSILSNKEKARETQITDAQTANSQKQIALQEADIKKKQAEFDKIVSIAKVTQATAIAEVQALTYLSNPFTAPLYPAIAATIAALGAVQLASIIATPLPKFEKGGTVTKDGPIITGEAGTELRIDPSGKASFTQDHANVSYAKAGTKIINNKDLVQMLAKPEQVMYIAHITNDNKKLEKLMEQNNDLLKKQKAPVVKVFADKFGNTYANRNY